MLEFAAVLMFPALVLSSEITKYADCGSHGYITAITVSPDHVIDGQGNNVFYLNQTYRTTVHFNPTENFETRNLNGLATGIVPGTNFPMIINHDPCASGDVQCPIHVEHPLTYHANMKWPDKSEVRFVVKWQLHDPAQNKDVVCLAFPALYIYDKQGPIVGREIV